MAPKQQNSGIHVGLKKGHVVTPKELAPRPSDRKGVSIQSIFVIFLEINFCLCFLISLK